MPSCQAIRTALAQCLAESDCVMQGNKPGDCLRLPLSETLPDKCKQLKYTYGQCKRNLIDMRKRFRGPLPVNYEQGSQMYAGLGDKKSGGQGTDAAGDGEGR